MHLTLAHGPNLADLEALPGEPRKDCLRKVINTLICGEPHLGLIKVW